MYNYLINLINSIITTNGVKAITGAQLRNVVTQLLNGLVGRPRVIAPGQTHTVAAATEQSWVGDLYNKGMLEIKSLPPDNYGDGISVNRDGIVHVQGTVVNEGTIINNGQII